jgi:hypothetical protein
MAARKLSESKVSLPARRAKAVKCGRRVCQRRSRDPKADGWIWLESTTPGMKTGWRCPECMAGLQRLMEQLVEEGLMPPPVVEQLN